MFMLTKAIESLFKDKALTEAFDALVAAYYQEYEDADELDHEAEASLLLWFELCFPGGETPDGREFADLISKRRGGLRPSAGQ